MENLKELYLVENKIRHYIIKNKLHKSPILSFAQFYHRHRDFVLNKDIDEDFNFSCNRPITNAYKQMKLWNIPISIKFWKWYVSHDWYESDMKASFLFELFTKFLETTRTKSTLNQHQFTIKIIKNKYCSSIPGDKKHETKLKIDYDFIYSEIDKYYDLEN